MYDAEPNEPTTKPIGFKVKVKKSANEKDGSVKVFKLEKVLITKR